MTEAWPHDSLRPRAQGPLRPRADGQRTRDTILRAAATVATIGGLDGLSIGSLADFLGMSKTGLSAHFGSKQELQLATVTEAARIFDEEVVQPALVAPAGLGQLAGVCEAFFEHLERHMFPERCFMGQRGPGDRHPLRGRSKT